MICGYSKKFFHVDVYFSHCKQIVKFNRGTRRIASSASLYALMGFYESLYYLFHFVQSVHIKNSVQASLTALNLPHRFIFLLLGTMNNKL